MEKAYLSHVLCAKLNEMGLRNNHWSEINNSVCLFVFLCCPFNPNKATVTSICLVLYTSTYKVWVDFLYITIQS